MGRRRRKRGGETLTREILELGKSSQGGWSRKQLELLGVAWPAPRGWQRKVIGRRFKRSIVVKFLALQDEHLRPRPWQPPRRVLGWIYEKEGLRP